MAQFDGTNCGCSSTSNTRNDDGADPRRYWYDISEPNFGHEAISGHIPQQTLSLANIAFLAAATMLCM